MKLFPPPYFSWDYKHEKSYRDRNHFLNPYIRKFPKIYRGKILPSPLKNSRFLNPESLVKLTSKKSEAKVRESDFLLIMKARQLMLHGKRFRRFLIFSLFPCHCFKLRLSLFFLSKKMCVQSSTASYLLLM
jgi:hypothetical protein